MRWQKTQAQVEEAVYDAMDELSETLSIPIKYYPEVRWVGRTLKFDDLMLAEARRAEIESRLAQGLSFYQVESDVVVIAGNIDSHAVLEEAAHAFHFAVSGLRIDQRTARDRMCLAFLTETMAFLGARLIGSVLINPYEDFPDLMAMPDSDHAIFRHAYGEILGDLDGFDDIVIHQQGYGLADRIYFKYLSGEVPISRIRRLFLSKLPPPEGAINRFIRLRNEFWPVEAEVYI